MQSSIVVSHRFLGTKTEKKFIPSDSEADEETKGELVVQPTEEQMMTKETESDEDLTYS